MGDVSKGKWISLLDYAAQNGVSISTLRRKIKKRTIPFRQDKGRYFLFAQNAETAETKEKAAHSSNAAMAGSSQQAVDLFQKIRSEKEQLNYELLELTTQLRNAQEEIAELKMLVTVYEETLSKNNSLRR